MTAADGTPRARRSVAVFGSCTSHDNFNSRFNPDHAGCYRVALRANQTSVITMMSPPVETEFTPTREMSDYDRWNVRSDLSREFLPLLAELKPDYLILDFFTDIHFGVLRLEDGRYLTNNRWKLWHTDLYQGLKQTDGFTRLRITDDPDGYFAVWAEALDRFAAFVAEHCPDTRVIVHCGFNTDEVIPPGSDRPMPIRAFRKVAPLDVELANQLWARLDDHAISTYGWEAIDLRNEGYMTFPEHPWHAFYVHYTMDYYHRFLAELDVLDLRDELEPDAFERVRAVARAAHEHAVQYAETRGRAMRAQEGRMRELERLGLARSVRFALGQRLRQTRARRAGRKSAGLNRENT